MSSLPIMVTWAAELVGDARVMTQPMSITTRKPSSTKKSRVAAGRSDLMFRAVRLITMAQFYRTARSSPGIRPFAAGGAVARGSTLDRVGGSPAVEATVAHE